MREIRNIVIHCTATPLTTTVESIKRHWREHLGWKNPGYHFLIEKNGNVEYLHDIKKVANGVRGHNQNSIHIAYIGGVDKNQMAIDNRTRQQCVSMLLLVNEFHEMFPKAEIKGHRDFNGVAKDCPSFDVKKWISANGFKI